MHEVMAERGWSVPKLAADIGDGVIDRTLNRFLKGSNSRDHWSTFLAYWDRRQAPADTGRPLLALSDMRGYAMSVYDLLQQATAQQRRLIESLPSQLAAPRFHTDGTLLPDALPTHEVSSADDLEPPGRIVKGEPAGKLAGSRGRR